jgi:hypothetical protein
MSERPFKEDDSIQRTLDMLQLFIDRNAERAIFQPPAFERSIALLEEQTGLTLPNSYRCFLRRFNGGFINICNIGPNDEHWDEKAARWNSNWLFGTGDLFKAYESARNLGGWEKINYLPFCQTSCQDQLVFFPKPNGKEPEVLDASHEASEWKVIYPSFQSMLLAYVKGGGHIETIAG